jgi:hypothetical protein
MGAVAGYRAVGSAHTSLQDTRQKLQEIRENLEAVPAKRQRQIEAAALRGRCKSFVHVKEKLQEYVLPIIRLSTLVNSEPISWLVCGIHTSI